MALEEDFKELLRQHKRIGIAGGPRMGKTTLSQLVTDRPVIGTDEYQGMVWEDIPERMIRDVLGVDSYVIEGVMVARALRRGLTVDAVVLLTKPKVARLPGQVTMAKGVMTVLKEWRAAHPEVPLYIE